MDIIRSTISQFKLHPLIESQIKLFLRHTIVFFSPIKSHTVDTETCHTWLDKVKQGIRNLPSANLNNGQSLGGENFTNLKVALLFALKVYPSECREEVYQAPISMFVLSACLFIGFCSQSCCEDRQNYNHSCGSWLSGVNFFIWFTSNTVLPKRYA